MKLLHLITVVLIALVPFVIQAETVYVIDKLLVGVHQDRDLNSAIVKVLPTGTALEVLSRDGELAEIKDPEGTQGWVDAAYLMSEVPAQLRVTGLSDENAKLKKELANSSNGAPTSTGNADRDTLTKENTDLKGKLSAEKLQVGELQAKVAVLETRVANHQTTPADTIIADLEGQNKKLARELEASMQANHQLEATQGDSPLPAMPVVINAISTPTIVAIIIAILLAFGAGIYTMDFLSRRRHGGFRI